MRIFLIIVVTFLILAAGFGIYAHFQSSTDPSTAATTQAQPAPAPKMVSESLPSIKVHEGTNVWMVRYDQQTGQIVSEFRAEKYQPRKDGTVDVDKPEAKFYLSNKQVLHIHGVDGDVVIPDSGAGGSAGGLASKQPTGFPTRGQLRNVRIELFENQKEEGAPSLVATLNNASFDNDTFRIYSDGFTGPDGKYVEPDQVPVIVRGVDYDFDGRGLTIRWNERDQHLQLLEIAHGEKLVVKNPSKMSMPLMPQTPATKPSARVDDVDGPVMLAAADKDAAINAIPSKKKSATKPTTKPARIQLPGKPKIVPQDKHILYRATFFDNVRIDQADQGTITGDQLKIDFLTDNPNQKSPTTSTTAPTTQKTNTPVAAATAPSTAPAEASAAPTTAPTSAPSTQPAQQPIVLTWTGKLRVVPLDSNEGDEGLEPNQAIARMTGSPVVIVRQDSRIECASLRYDTSGSRLLLEESPAVKLVMTGPNGERVTSATMDYSMADRRAILGGHGTMVTKIEQAATATQPTTQPAPTLTAAWSDSCTLHFSAADAHEQMAIDRVHLVGGVHIVHPQMDLKSRELEVGFAPTGTAASAAVDAPTTAPTTPAVAKVQGSIRDLTADGDVKCLMTDSSNKPQNIECDHLVLASATSSDGKLYPRTVTADGKVHTFDGEQDLHANHLVVTLAQPAPKSDESTQPAPTTAPTNGIPAVALERLEAQGNVKTVTKDGAIAYADQLFVTMAKDQPHVRLVGEPSAKVVNKDTTVTGPVIDLFPKDQHATISGAGTMHAIQEPTSAGATTRPIDVTWTEGAYVDGAKNQIDVNGKVVATSTQGPTTTNVARGEKLTLILAEAPTTQPTTRGATTTVSFAAADASSTFGNKVVRTIILSDQAQVDSDEVALADSALQRRMHLTAPEIRYETVDANGAPRKQMRIPTPGQMLYEDRRAPSTQPSASTDPNKSIGDSRGATAFQWQKQFVYDDETRCATMSGDVLIVHKPSDDAEAVSRLNANEVIAEFAPAASSPATTQRTSEPRLDLKRLRANGAVHFVARDVSFDAETIDYDPGTKILTARGSTHRPARLFDEKGMSKGSFAELRYNTQTTGVEMTDFVAEGRQGSGARVRSVGE